MRVVLRALAAAVREDRLLALATGSIVWLVVVQLPISDPDLGWHLAAGAEIARTHHVPTVDPFGYPIAGRPWIAYSWLAELVFWWVTTAVGAHALVALTALLAAACAVVVYRTCRDAGGASAPAFATSLLGALAALPYTTQRPVVASFVLAAVFARALLRHRRGLPVRLWTLAPLTALWANVHVFFVVGLGWLWGGALWDAGRRVVRGRGDGGRRLAPTALACSLATLCTPYGPSLLEHLLVLGQQPAAHAKVIEFTSPDFHLPGAWPALALVLATVAALAAGRGRRDPFGVLLVLGHLALGLLVQRNLPFLAIVAAPVIALAATRALGLPAAVAAPRAPLPLAFQAAAAALFVAAPLLRLPRDPSLEAHLKPGAFPTAAVEFVRAQPPLGRMFNSFGWGGYLIHELYPRYQVSMDGRTQTWGPLVAEYMTTHFVREGWHGYLDRLRPDFVLWERHAPLALALATDPGWAQVYADDTAVLFVRADHPLRARLLRAARRTSEASAG